MRILMIAPEPFFEPRGTPFSEYHRIRALIDLGHTVDLVTYPFGRDVSLPGLRVFRCVRPPLLNRIGIGPSWRKLPLDFSLFLTTCRRVMSDKYDAVHSHEEGAWWGVVIAGLFGLPHLYDMHSSLPQQLTNFAYSRSRLVKGIFAMLERFVIRRSRVVIVICPQLEEVVRGIDTAVPSVLIENAPGSGDAPAEGSGLAIRGELELGDRTPVVMYTGTFEAYQGLDLLFASMAHVVKSRPDARLVLVGGHEDQIEAARAQAAALGIASSVVFTGQRPAEQIPAFLDAADVLVSPRSLGTNTPLKIYQYLRAGRAIVATRLLTHTQVLDDDVSFLTEPTPEGFGAGILAAITDPGRARAVAARARHLADTKYSYEVYLSRTRQACVHLFDRAPQVAGGVACPPFALRPPSRERATAGQAATGGKPVADDTRHYSYEVYADPAMAERFDEMRFSGAIGGLIAQTQAQQLASFLSPLPRRTVLDVGTGTGRAAIALARAGAVVTGVDASAEMLAVAERRAREAGVSVAFQRGDAHRLGFADRSFDSVVCLRVLMHTPDWRASLGELCRVAAARVVFDYPSLYSAAALQAAVRRMTHVFNPAVEAYRVFSPSSVERVLAEAGFRVTRVHRQFVLPIALHKRVDSESWTRRVEGGLERVGLNRLFGSPVTVLAER